MSALARAETECPAHGPVRPTVLVMLGAYWPGHEATGPNQSYKALAAALCDTFDFKVVGRDRAEGATAPQGARGRWIDDGVHLVRFSPVGRLGAVDIGEILRTTPHEVLILNGFFDNQFTIPTLVQRRLGRVPRRPTILAPRGEFSPGALGLKPVRKQAYLALARGTGLIDDVVLHATGEQEAVEIRTGCPWARDILVAPNIRVLRALPESARPRTAIDPLRIVFLSRIDRKKNLDYAIDVLARVSVPVEFDIYGPTGDAAYWSECERAMTRLPSHIHAHYKGAIANSAVPAVLSEYDLFFLPTLGENFGHAIFDALEAGLPVLISDQTPWYDLEQCGAGWTISLGDPTGFVSVIERFTRLKPDGRAAARQAARKRAESSVETSDAVAQSRAMLLEASAKFRAQTKVNLS